MPGCLQFCPYQTLIIEPLPVVSGSWGRAYLIYCTLPKTWLLVIAIPQIPHTAQLQATISSRSDINKQYMLDAFLELAKPWVRAECESLTSNAKGLLDLCLRLLPQSLTPSCLQSSILTVTEELKSTLDYSALQCYVPAHWWATF